MMQAVSLMKVTSKMLAVVVVSGGMDSVTLLHLMNRRGYDLEVISFDYGQRHVKELAYAKYWANHFSAKHHLVNLTCLTNLISNSALTNKDIPVPDGHYTEDSMKVTVVPNRNAMMISIATALAVNIKADCVAVGVHFGDHTIYPDCRKEFIDSINKTMILANLGFLPEGFEIVAPFIGVDKTEICLQGADMGVNWSKTWSCYKGGKKQCGSCATCRERKEAFSLAGVVDPTDYIDKRKNSEY